MMDTATIDNLEEYIRKGDDLLARARDCIVILNKERSQLLTEMDKAQKDFEMLLRHGLLLLEFVRKVADIKKPHPYDQFMGSIINQAVELLESIEGKSATGS